MNDPEQSPAAARPDEERAEAQRTGMILALWAKRQPTAPAVVDRRKTLSFGELNARANQLARALRARGARAGDGLAVMCSNRAEFVEVFGASRRIGLRLTPINWHLTAEEAAYIVANCDATVFIADARFRETAARAAAQAPAARIRLGIGGEIDGFEPYDEVIGAESPDDIENPTLGVNMFYTSGTTGRPKGVHRQAYVPPPSPMTAAAGYQAGRDRHLCTGPLYHAAPLSLSMAIPLGEGVPTVLMDGWDAEETLRLIEAHRITHTHMVPTMFHRLLSLPEERRHRYDVSSLKFVLHGAAPCPVPVKERLIEWVGPIVYEYYAATEGVGSVVTAEEWLERPGTVGKPEAPDHFRIVDESGNVVPTNTIGTIYLKAAEVGRFAYYKDEEKTRNAYRGDYFTLGDVGYLDDDGYLYLTDRSANLIISGGVNIYPAEAEAVLLTHPSVGDVAVIGVPNPDWGEEVKAVVELKHDHERSSELGDELVAFCRSRIAHYKCPRSVDFVDKLPRHDNGKLYKQALRDQYRSAAPVG